jgi:hypothetical protein
MTYPAGSVATSAIAVRRVGSGRSMTTQRRVRPHACHQNVAREPARRFASINVSFLESQRVLSRHAAAPDRSGRDKRVHPSLERFASDRTVSYPRDGRLTFGYLGCRDRFKPFARLFARERD